MDIGGTKTLVTVSNKGVTFSNPLQFSTPQNFSEALELFKTIKQDVLELRQVECVVVGIAGLLDPSKKQLDYAPHLPDWGKKPLTKELKKIFHAPVYLENDAALGALGEAHYGSGKNKKIVAYLTFSTGVGGARVVSGKLDTHRIGFEIGHHIINCERLETFEDYASGSSIGIKSGKKAEIIKNKKLWGSVAQFCAIGIYNAALFWSPDVIVLGGSMTKSLNLDRIREYLKNINTVLPKFPPIKKAKFLDKSVLYGALLFAHQQKLKNDTQKALQ